MTLAHRSHTSVDGGPFRVYSPSKQEEDMKLDMWEVMACIVLWWMCATIHNHLNWIWQLDYERALAAQFNTQTEDRQ